MSAFLEFTESLFYYQVKKKLITYFHLNSTTSSTKTIKTREKLT